MTWFHAVGPWEPPARCSGRAACIWLHARSCRCAVGSSIPHPGEATSVQSSLSCVCTDSISPESHDLDLKQTFVRLLFAHEVWAAAWSSVYSWGRNTGASRHVFRWFCRQEELPLQNIQTCIRLKTYKYDTDVQKLFREKKSTQGNL